MQKIEPHKENNFIYDLLPDGFVAGPNGEMNRIKVGQEMWFDASLHPVNLAYK